MTDNNTLALETSERIVAGLKNLLTEMTRAGLALDELFETVKADSSIHPSTLATMYFGTKELYEDLDKAVKRVYHFNDGLNKFLIPERLRAHNMDGIRVPAIGRSFSIVEKTSASMVDKEKAFEWLRENGQGDLIQETVNAGTLASFCRNMLLEMGIEPPPELFKVTTYSTTSMTKYRPKVGEV